jgi:hypothetical protein
MSAVARLVMSLVEGSGTTNVVSPRRAGSRHMKEWT